MKKVTGNHRVINGKAISSGVVLGHARVIWPGDIRITELSVPASGVNRQVKALESAVTATISELEELRDSASKKMGGPVAKIFDAQLLIADDKEFLSKVKDDIRARKRNAAFIYHDHINKTTAPLKSSTDPYIRQMAQDIQAVADRVVEHLSGNSKRKLKIARDTILVGKSFTPGEVLAFRQQKVIGFVVKEGGPNSHMALIARALYMPVVVVEDLMPTQFRSGIDLVVDGVDGKVIVGPTKEELVEYHQKKRRLGPALITRIKKLKQIPPETRDGVKVPIAGNLTLPGPAEDILAEMKIPVGLYRSEFMYLAANHFPDEEEQYEHYEAVASRFAGTTVIIRTFDLGYDKLSTDTVWPAEDNPALGWRGIRPMLEMTEVFKSQIRSILRASTRKNLKILLPMVSDVSELEKTQKLISQVKFELKKKKIAFDDKIPVGIMIEIPSAVLMAKTLFPRSDFVSIGTNDLTQYVMAADRKNTKVDGLYNSFHPAVLKMIQITVETAKSLGKEVSVCGEMAGDLLALPFFIGIGVDSLSMSPARIVNLCRMVNKIDSNSLPPLVKAVMSSPTAEAVTKRLESFRNALESRKRRK
jgi:phosphotransferase system enzyme I (PtsI)